MYERRLYRNLFKGENLVFFDVCLYETDLRIGVNTGLSCEEVNLRTGEENQCCGEASLRNEAMSLVRQFRSQLISYIRECPEFLTSLKPIKVRPDAPYIVNKMCEVSEKAGVGPMAAVAGAISEMVGRELLKYTGEIIVENGGDVFIKTDTVRKAGIYAGNSPLSGKIALEILPEKTPAGICTSSGTVGHSFSFGKADAAVIVSGDAFLADAAATALGNMVRRPEDLEDAVLMAASIEGVDGALVIMGDKMAVWGDLKLVGTA